MAFSMVLCVNFNLWSWVYFFDSLWGGDLFVNLKNKMLKSELKLYQERLFLFFFFLALILSACIITSSLIHEAKTLMRKTLQALRAPFIGSNCLLDWKGLLKARNVGYGLWLWKKGILQAQKVFEGFKNLGSTSTVHYFFLSCCLCRESDLQPY
jgi:hypothetical protein